MVLGVMSFPRKGVESLHIEKQESVENVHDCLYALRFSLFSSSIGLKCITFLGFCMRECPPNFVELELGENIRAQAASTLILKYLNILSTYFAFIGM